MKDKTYHAYLDSHERQLVIHSLVELKNRLIQEGRYTDCVDELIFNVVNTRASNLWEYSWMKEWLNSYSTDSARAEKALEELEKAFDMPYMGTDRCDDATRNYLRENIDKAKLGDPSGFRECIELNYE